MSKILIAALEYEEPEYEHTRKSLNDLINLHPEIHIQYFSRDGVGSMSRAFNRAHVYFFDYIWFITNITFDPDVPLKLAEFLDSHPGYAAIHPAMAGSDHKFLWPSDDKPHEIPYTEWTAPMVREHVFLREPLNENLPYYYFDLDWSYRVKQKGWQIAVHPTAGVKHAYLRNSGSQHPISRIRRQLRDYWTPKSQEYMVKTYGPNWKKVMGWRG